MPLISVCPIETSQKDTVNVKPPISIHQTNQDRSKKEKK